MSSQPSPRLDMLPMNAADLDGIMAIENAVHPFPWTRGNFTDSLAADCYSAWVCRSGDDLLGYAVMMIAVDEVHLMNLSIHPERQRQGLGARFLSYLMDTAAALGGRSMLLEVRPSNTPALTLYQNFGFRHIGLRKSYYPAQQGREDALVLERLLDGAIRT